MKTTTVTPRDGAQTAGPERRPTEVWRVSLTCPGLTALAAADLDDLHQEAHMARCAGYHICRATLPRLQRVVTTVQTEAQPGAPRAGEDRRGPTSPPPEGVRP